MYGPRDIVEKSLKSRRFALITNLIVFGATLIVCLLLVEAGLRLFAPQNIEPHPRGLYIADPELGYVLAPRQSGVHFHPDFQAEIHTNSLGLREREIGPKKPGERRLLLLGDSFTFGWGVNIGQTYPRQIEEALRQAGHANVKVINAGVSGYGTHQEVMWFERIADEIMPDAVIVGFFLGNDFYDNLGVEQFEVIDGYLVRKTQHRSGVFLLGKLGISPKLKIMLRTRLHSYTLLMNAWTASMIMTGLDNTASVLEIYRESPSSQTKLAITATRTALVRFAEACRNRNIDCGLVLVPSPRAARALDGKSGYRFDRPNEIVRELALLQSLPLLDLGDILKGTNNLHFPIDGHLNAEGSLIAGRAIAESLLRGELRAILDLQN